MSRRVLLLCGPPGAGKSTKARALAREQGLAVYDSDDAHWGSQRQFTRAIRRLANQPDAQVVVIRAGATRSARARAGRQVGATEVEIMATDPKVCAKRVRARARPEPPLKVQLAAVGSWWRSFEPDGGPERPSKTRPLGGRPPRPPRSEGAAGGARGAERLLSARPSDGPLSRRISPLEKKAAKTAARGYGTRHQALRKKLTPTVEAGQARCARCGKPIFPGEPWDLGHVDGSNKTAYSGPEHQKCNRSTAGRNRKPSKRRQSRKW